MVNREAKRLARLLETSVQSSGAPPAEVERRAGLAPGALSRAGTGEQELTLGQLLLVLRELGLEAAAFFHLAYPQQPEATPGPKPIVEELVETFQGLGYGGTPPVGRPGPPIGADELRDLIKTTIREVFGERAQAPGEDPGAVK